MLRHGLGSVTMVAYGVSEGHAPASAVETLANRCQQPSGHVLDTAFERRLRDLTHKVSLKTNRRTRSWKRSANV